MEAEFRDLEFVDNLCRLDREMERYRSADLERGDLLVQSRSPSEPLREWITPGQWESTAVGSSNDSDLPGYD
jgi:hypothetical protein